MATQNIDVRVNTQQATASLNGLKTAFAGLTAAVSAGAIVRFGDSVTALQNKLRVVSKDTADAQRQFNAIVQIADQSRTSLGDIATLYSRIALAAGDMGRSQQESAIIVDTIAKALSAMGATTSEAGSAMLQLSQAFGSGVLRGEEFNAMMENAPNLARLLAASLGEPVGALRKMAEEGRLTADRVAQAFIDSNASITETFGKSQPTIAQAFQTLGNALTKVFDELERDTGIFRDIAEAIISLSQSLADMIRFIKENQEAFKTLGSIMVALGAAFFILGPGIRLVEGAAKALIVAFAGTARSTALISGLIFGAQRAVVSFRKAVGLATIEGMKLNRVGYAIQFVNNSLKTLLRFAGIAGIFVAITQGVALLLRQFELGRAVLDGIGSAFDWVRGKLGLFQEEQTKTMEVADDAISQLSDEAEKRQQIIKITDDQARALRDLVRGYQDSIEQQISSLRVANDLIGATDEQRRLTDALQQAESAYYNTARSLQDQLTEARKNAGKSESELVARLQQELRDLDQSYQNNALAIRDLIVQQTELTRAREFDLFATQSQQRAQDQLIALQSEMAKLTMPEIEQKYYDIAAAADASARAAIRAEEARRGAPLDIEEQKKYYDQARRGNDALKRQTRELYEASRTFATGWRRAFNEYVQRATDSARQAEKIFGTFTQGLEDLIVDFVKTGKFEWKSFVDSILEELLRSQIQQTLGGLFETLGLAKLFGGSSQTRGNSPSSPLFVQPVSGGAGGITPSGGGLFDTISNVFSGGGQSNNPIQPSTATPGFGGGIIDTIGSVASGIGNFAKSVGGGLVDTISSAGSWINKNLFGGFFANGGTLPSGKFGIVGERGPEMISGPATITPMGTTQVTYNISAVDARSFQQLVASDPSFIYAVTEQGRRNQPIARSR